MDTPTVYEKTYEGGHEVGLMIRNTGRLSARFSVECSVVGQRNPRWDVDRTAMRQPYTILPVCTIAGRDSTEAQVGRTYLYDKTILAFGLVRNDAGVVTWHSNDRVDGANPPEWDLRVTVWRHGWLGGKQEVATGKYAIVVRDGKPILRARTSW